MAKIFCLLSYKTKKTTRYSHIITVIIMNYGWKNPLKETSNKVKSFLPLSCCHHDTLNCFSSSSRVLHDVFYILISIIRISCQVHLLSLMPMSVAVSWWVFIVSTWLWIACKCRWYVLSPCQCIFLYGAQKEQGSR